MASLQQAEAYYWHIANRLSMSVNKPSQKYKVHNDHVYERRVVHRFTMGDLEDPELYCAQPIYEWQQTEHGKWIMAHSLEPTFHIHTDPLTYGYQIVITAHITPKRWTEYVLRGWYTG